MTTPEDFKEYEWIGSPPDPWLPHFKQPMKTLYCLSCEEWKAPADSKILWTNNVFRYTPGHYNYEEKHPVVEDVYCPDCDTELITRPEGYTGHARWVWWKHTLFTLDKRLGWSPKFLDILIERIDDGKSVQVTFTGRAGEGKTYFMLKLAQILNPFMTIDQVVFTREKFVSFIMKAKPKTILCVDETSYVGGKRSWQNPKQQETMLVWESMRSKLLPVFSTVLNISLLDKTYREQIVQFLVNVVDRGHARIYSVNPHPLEDYVGKKRIQRMSLRMPDWNFCKRKSCLLPRCQYINICPLLRAQYERKKEEIQSTRYEAAAETVASPTKSFLQWMEEFLKIKDRCYVTVGDKEKLDRELIELELGCSGSMAQRIRQLATRLPENKLLEYIEKHREASGQK